MKRQFTPQEKKDLSYSKDHVVNSEYRSSFERYWPLKKARANRAYRRKVQQLATNLTQPRDEDQRHDFLTDPVKRKVTRKWGSSTLRDWVKERLRQRVQRTAYNHFKEPYQGKEDRQRFVGFLNAITIGQRGQSADLAQFFRLLLESRSHREWLDGFFRDEHEWQERVYAWIASFPDQEEAAR